MCRYNCFAPEIEISRASRDQRVSYRACIGEDASSISITRAPGEDAVNRRWGFAGILGKSNVREADERDKR